MERIGLIAREPDGEGFWASIEGPSESALVHATYEFDTVEAAIDWVEEQVDLIVIRYGFSPEHEFFLGDCPEWSGRKKWPPAPEERSEIDAHVSRLIGDWSISNTSPGDSAFREAIEAETPGIGRHPNPGDDRDSG